LVARTEKLLQEVKRECMDLGLDEGKILLCQGDVTNTADLLAIRNKIESGKLNEICTKLELIISMARYRHSPYTSGRTIYPDSPRYSPSQTIRPAISEVLEPASEKGLLGREWNRSCRTKSRWYGESSSRSKGMRRGELRRYSSNSSLFRMSSLLPVVHAHI
jgi:hypothetical protein